MPQIRVETVRNGQHPSEVVVAVKTADGGTEKLVVDRRSIRNGTLDVGYPVGREGNRLLVELPRESMRGLWRVWVSHDAVITEEAAA